MINIALSTSILYKEKKSVTDLADLLDRMKIELAEIYMKELLDESLLQRFIATWDQDRYRTRTHLHAGIDLSRKLDSNSIKLIERSLQVSSRLNADAMTVHPGFHSRDMLIRNLLFLIELADNYGIRICLENGYKPGELCRKTEEILKILDNLSESGYNIRATYDIGRSFQAGENIYDSLNILNKKGYLLNIHTVDHENNSYEIKALGEGVIDMTAVFKFRNSVWYVLELDSIEKTVKSIRFIEDNILQ